MVCQAIVQSGHAPLRANPEADADLQGCDDVVGVVLQRVVERGGGIRRRALRDAWSVWHLLMCSWTAKVNRGSPDADAGSSKHVALAALVSRIRDIDCYYAVPN